MPAPPRVLGRAALIFAGSISAMTGACGKTTRSDAPSDAAAVGELDASIPFIPEAASSAAPTASMSMRPLPDAGKLYATSPPVPPYGPSPIREWEKHDIRAMTPLYAFAGDPDLTIEIEGGSFNATTTVYANDAPLKTTFVNASRVRAVIPASAIAKPGVLTITLSGRRFFRFEIVAR